MKKFLRLLIAANEGETPAAPDFRQILAEMLGLTADADDAAILAAATAAKNSEPTPEEKAEMEAANERFKAGCKALGIAENSTPEAFHAALLAVPGQLKAANEATGTEREGRVKLLLDAAVADGRITLADRAAWEKRFSEDAAAAETALAAAEKKIPSQTAGNIGGRKMAISNEKERQATLIAAANELMTARKIPFTEAWAILKKDPAYQGVFQAMSKGAE